MELDIFLDTNILHNDYFIRNRRLLDLCEFLDDGLVSYRLCIAEMTYYELIKHYEIEFENMLNELKSVKKVGGKFFLEDNFFDFNYNKNELTIKYKMELEKNFSIIKPSSDAATNVFKRYYEDKAPFLNSKTEFKDALIWETIEEEYKNKSERNSDDCYVWFVTNNSKDFGKYNDIHEDFNNYNDKIIIFNNLTELLENEEIITNIEENQDEQGGKLITKVTNMLEQNNMLTQETEYMLEQFISSSIFLDEYGIEGYGNSLFINKLTISKVHIDEAKKSKSTLYIPITLKVEFEFNVETKNPVYEKYDIDIDEYISLDVITDEREIKCEVICEINKDKILEINNFEML